MWAEDFMRDPSSFSGWLSNAGRYLHPSDIALWVLDNSPFPSSPTPLNVAELWGYREATLNTPNYSGSPDVLVRIPAGRGHGFTVLESGHLVVASSEDEGGNGNESWFLVPPNAEGDLTEEQCPRFRCSRIFAGTVHETQGARYAAQFADGTIILGNVGGWAKCTLEQMLADEMDGLPIWEINSDGNGEIPTYGYAPDPAGGHKLWHNGDDRIFRLDFDVAPTLYPPGLDHSKTKFARGSNIGRPPGEAWFGFVTFDAYHNVWKPRGTERDLACWQASVLSAFGPPPGTNPPPFKTLRCPLWDALNLDNEGVYCGVEFLADGRMLVHSRSYDNAPNPTIPAKLYIFEREAWEAGGSHMPINVITLPASSQPFDIRATPRFRLRAR